jgi:predicted metal-binding membrane protein
MMIAMMVPSALPLVLLYGRVVRQASAGPSPPAKGMYAPPLFLLAGYLLAWLGFSLLAVTIQYTLQRSGLIADMMLSSRSGFFSATMLLAAGLYQLSPLKQACLRQCRSPVYFLTRHWQPGRHGALMMGLRHGAWCVGCCWTLMLLLLVGGVMNAVWIALLALLVLLEKLLPGGLLVSRLAGGLLIAWGLATLLV